MTTWQSFICEKVWDSALKPTGCVAKFVFPNLRRLPRKERRHGRPVPGAERPDANLNADSPALGERPLTWKVVVRRSKGGPRRGRRVIEAREKPADVNTASSAGGETRKTWPTLSQRSNDHFLSVSLASVSPPDTQ